MDFKDIGINTRNSVDSAQDRDYLRVLVNASLNLRVPKAMKLVNEGFRCLLHFERQRGYWNSIVEIRKRHDQAEINVFMYIRAHGHTHTRTLTKTLACSSRVKHTGDLGFLQLVNR